MKKQFAALVRKLKRKNIARKLRKEAKRRRSTYKSVNRNH